MSSVVRSKEEILEKIEGQYYTTIDVMGAMDEYAKQESIAFGEWVKTCDYVVVESEELKKDAWVNCKENEVMVHGSDWHYTTLINECGITTEQLYELFIKSKS